ncbi:MAG: PRC-barrel domain-containing protein [Coriobacteriia bacterium]|nr:PRC-barrel domain-containing protein [Coriobacteriia bacterium]
MFASPGSQVSLREIYRTPVLFEKSNGKIKLLGRIDDVLFDLDDLYAVGFSAKRSWPGPILPRRYKHRYIARDVLVPATDADGKEVFILASGAKAGQAPAGADRAFSWDRTVIFYGLPVYTTELERLGKVSDALIRMDDGRLGGLEISAGTASDATLGKRTLPASYVREFVEAQQEEVPHVLLVDPAAKNCAYAGGLASLVGTVSGKANIAAEKAAVAAGAAAGHVANAATTLWGAKGRPLAAQAGQQVTNATVKVIAGTQQTAKKAIESDAGKAAKKRAQEMWGGFSEGYRQGRHGPDTDD